MAARLERDIEIGIARRSTGLFQRDNLRVRFAGPCMIALPNDSAVLHHDCAYHRIGAGAAASFGRKNQGVSHEAFIIRREHPTS
jgi:hypothetical protein